MPIDKSPFIFVVLFNVKVLPPITKGKAVVPLVATQSIYALPPSAANLNTDFVGPCVKFVLHLHY